MSNVGMNRTGLDERNLVFRLVCALCPALRELGYRQIVGTDAQVEAWLSLMPSLGEAAMRCAEQRMASAIGQRDLAKATKRRDHLAEIKEKWRAWLGEARASDKAYLAKVAMRAASQPRHPTARLSSVSRAKGSENLLALREQIRAGSGNGASTNAPTTIN